MVSQGVSTVSTIKTSPLGSLSAAGCFVKLNESLVLLKFNENETNSSETGEHQLAMATKKQ